MKILFVCQNNNGRSQMAKAIYNQLSNSNDATSAGTEVDVDGQPLIERAEKPGSALGITFEVMEEIGIHDMREFSRTLLKPEMLKNYDKVIAIMKPEFLPEYLKSYAGVVIWNIDDPRSYGIEGLREIRDEIKAKVEELFQE